MSAGRPRDWSCRPTGRRASLGNETIRIHPDQRWLEIRLPTPLGHLSNTLGRAPTYRLSCPVVFHHRSGEWAAQVANGAVRYDIVLDPAKKRWYVDASWRLPSRQVPTLEELRKHRGLGLDLNAQHIDCWVLDAAGTRSERLALSRWRSTGSRPVHAMAAFGQRSPR